MLRWTVLAGLVLATPAFAQSADSIPPQAEAPASPLKADLARRVEARAKLAQEINDSVFSFGELGYQEVETSRYLTGILRRNGFTVVTGVAGMPTGWTATWTQGKGGPVIALGSDIDGIPKASQKPGVARREPIVEGAPGHGEGHNSGQAVILVAALALQELMREKGIDGTIVIFPGVAEELLGGKAYFVRDGVFKGVDAAIFAHVSDNLSTSWGAGSGTGLVSVQYTFTGEASHAAGSPWLGRSALDAVELMDIGWNFRREHLRPQQRSHYVITDGGDQPNVVPPVASSWYFFRETNFANVARNYQIGNTIAEAAAKMTDTTVTHRIVGTAAPTHFNRPLAEAIKRNIDQVGLPGWTEPEMGFARSVQRLVGSDPTGLAADLPALRGPDGSGQGGGSDDIGDVSWTIPTAVVRYPSNIPGVPAHNWASAIAMATPIAHKGAVAGAKVVAMTAFDFLTDPALRKNAEDYFRDVQNKDERYVPMLGPADRPQVQINADVLAQYRERMRKFYYDPKRYKTYLDQLGIAWPPPPES